MNEDQARNQMTRRLNAALVQAGWQQVGEKTDNSTCMADIVAKCGQPALDHALMAAFNSLPPEEQMLNGTFGSVVEWLVNDCTLDQF